MERPVLGHKRSPKDLKTTTLSLLTSLKQCAKNKDLYQGSKIHADIRDSGLLEKNTYLANTLVSMYAKCGALERAQQVLDELPTRNAISWNALISGYVQQGHGEEALNCFRKMQSEGLSPDSITYASSLKACGITQKADVGQKIHDEIVTQGLLKRDVILGNALVSMYVKCGDLEKAQNVLDELPVRDVVSWSALITGYAQKGQGKEALVCFGRMQDEGLLPDATSYASILKACGTMRDTDTGKKIHDEIVSQGLLEKSVVLGTALVDMYCKCGILAKAQEILDGLSGRNVISWSALITGYAQQGQGEEALSCYHQMQSEGFSPDAIAYASILKACGILGEAETGQKVHDEIASKGLLEKDVVLGTSLVDMYAKCGMLLKAQEVLDQLSVRDGVSWSALIAGYAQQGQGKEALQSFRRMRGEGFCPNSITYACVLKACGITREVDMGKKIHEEIVSQRLLEKNVQLGNALVDMYAKCGLIKMAHTVLEELPIRDLISWGALIGGYVQHGQSEKALSCFRKMRSEGLCPDAITYACILKACGIMQDVDTGIKIHDEVNGQGLLEKNVVVGTALVDMYAKCGVLNKAKEVFDQLPVRNEVSWSALIAGHAQQGQGTGALDCLKLMQIEGLTPDVVSWSAVIGGYSQQGLAEEALDCFECMQSEGISPNAITFVSVLSACSHSGLVEEGQMYFESMRDKYGVVPKREHLASMVDLFGRARRFDKVINVIKKAQFSDYPPVWSALLGACQKWGNVKLGRLAFEHVVQLDGRDAAAYVVMANIYVSAGMHDEGQMIDSMRVKKFCLAEPRMLNASGNGE